MKLGLGLPQHQRERAFLCCSDPRSASAMTHNLVVKYNDLPQKTLLLFYH